MAQPVNTPIYKQFAAMRTAFYVLFVALFLCFPQVSRAENNPAYTVEGVEVDVTSENAVKAREKALDEAQSKAYGMLAERFLGEEGAKTIQMPDPITLSTLVQDYEVTKEQLSKRRYKGVFTIRFRPTAMKMQMASQGRVYSDQTQNPVLVLPLMQVGGSTVLWGEGNPFMTAWRSLPSDQSLLHPTILPLGDAEDIAKITGEEALQYDPMDVQALADKYGADDIAILLASTEPTQTAQGRLVVNIYSNGFDGPQFVQKISLDQGPEETDDALYSRAVQQVKGILRANWKANAAYNPAMPPATQNPPTGYPPAHAGGYYAQDPRTAGAPVPYTRPALGPVTTYNTYARFASVQDWVKMKNKLDSIYGMQAVMIKAMKPREAMLDIRYAGNINALQLALQNAGITLRASPTGGPMEIYMGPTQQQPIYR